MTWVSWNERQAAIKKRSATCLFLLALCLCCDPSVLHSMLIWSKPPVCYLKPTGISPGFTYWMWSLCKSRYFISFYTTLSFKLLFKFYFLHHSFGDVSQEIIHKNLNKSIIYILYKLFHKYIYTLFILDCFPQKNCDIFVMNKLILLNVSQERCMNCLKFMEKKETV